MRVLSYSRVSTSHHEQKPEIQVNEIRRFCQMRDWTIAEELVDHGFSGSTENRPGFKNLMRIVRAGEIECVVVLKLDRLFRSLKHLVSTLEEFEKLGVKFVAIKDAVDYSTPTGRLFVQILGSLGEFERSMLRERTIMGLAHARTLGKTLGRPRIHNVEQIMRMRAEGYTYRKIQQELRIPMGTIARAIKAARNTPVATHSYSQKLPAPLTVVLRAFGSKSFSTEMDMSTSVENADGASRDNRDENMVADEKE